MYLDIKLLKNGLRSIITTTFFMFLANAAICQYTNIKIVENRGQSIGPCEPSIVIAPDQPNKMLAAVVSSKERTDDPQIKTLRNRIFLSDNYGEKWTKKRINRKYGNFGDPTLIADNNGYFYYVHLSDPEKRGWASSAILDRIVCQRSSKGLIWSKGSFTGLNPPKDQYKPHAAFDSHSGRIYITWTQFDQYNSDNPQDSASIMFSYSPDRGISFTPPVRINQYNGNCRDNDLTPEGAMPTAGPNGSVYVSWAYNEKIYFDRSLDGGVSWLKKDIVVADQPGGWTFEIPGLQRANGMPIIDCDLSLGPYNGHIYVNWSDQRNGERDTDIWFSRSTDGGDTWSTPIRVNDDPKNVLGAQQFYSWMTIDQITGIIYIVFYDRRNYEDQQTDVFLAYSNDGGSTWTNEKISDSPFIPDNNQFFGDSNDIAAYAGIVRPVWTRMENGKLSVWTALVDFR